MDPATIAAGASLIGGVLGASKPLTYVPRRATKNTERDRLTAQNEILYGSPGDTPWRLADGVNPWAGTAQGGLDALYNNPQNWMTYGPRPFADVNPMELGAIGSLMDFAQNAYPGMYGNYANNVMSMMGGSPGLGMYGNAMTGALPALQQRFAAGPGDPMTNNALAQMMSGSIDPRGLTGAMDSYLQPMLERFNEQLLPSLQRADAASAGGQSTAGALKAAQRTQEQIGEGANAYAQGLLYQANKDAMDRMGLGAQLSIGQNDAFMNQLLTGAGLGADSMFNNARIGAEWSRQMPDVFQMGLLGPEAIRQSGDMMRRLQDPYAEYDFQRHMFEQRQPFEMGNAWFNILSGVPAPTPSSHAPVMSSGSPLSAIIGGLGGMFGGDKKDPSATIFQGV